MKNLIIIALALFSISVQAQEAKRYAIKSGYLKLELGGNTEGTREIWWDNYGDKSRTLEKSTTTTKMFGIKSTDEKHMLTITNKEKIWVIDYVNDEATATIAPYYQQGKDFANSMTEEEREEFGKNALTQMGGRIEGKESINGYECDIVKMMGVRTWVHKGIALKTEGKLMGIKTLETLADFKPNAKVSAADFERPPGVQFDDISEEVAEMTGGFGELANAMQEMEEEIVPVDYPFEKFKKIVQGANLEGFSPMGINQMFGMYSATFVNGTKRLMVIAQSSKNGDVEDYVTEGFKHNGHTCYYASIEGDEEEEEESGTYLAIDYPKHDMLVVITALPEMSKNELLKIEDQMQF